MHCHKCPARCHASPTVCARVTKRRTLDSVTNRICVVYMCVLILATFGCLPVTAQLRWNGSTATLEREAGGPMARVSRLRVRLESTSLTNVVKGTSSSIFVRLFIDGVQSTTAVITDTMTTFNAGELLVDFDANTNAANTWRPVVNNA